MPHVVGQGEIAIEPDVIAVSSIYDVQSTTLRAVGENDTVYIAVLIPSLVPKSSNLQR